MWLSINFLILSKEDPGFKDLPGIAVLIGGMWIANLYYWGFNQYIIQRTFAAKSLKESQRGIILAAFLKLLIPLIVILPGVVAFVMYTESNDVAVRSLFEAMGGNDNAYPWLIRNFIPIGLKGLVVAALAAAIISSLASMLNSTSTIFTMDIYRQYFNKTASPRRLVNVGRLSAAVALVVAGCVAPAMANFDQMFIYIQEYTGLVSPGILAVFMMGLFWKKTTNRGAIVGALASIPVALLLKFLPIEMPFMDQMLYTFLITIVVIGMVSLTSSRGNDDARAIALNAEMFKTDGVFNVATYVICVLLVVLYVVFW